MKSKLKKFWDQFGYICVLSVCLTMIAATAFLTRAPKAEVAAPEVTRYATPTPVPTPRAVWADVTIAPTATESPFYLPCDGKIGMGYAEDTVIYNRTLGEYGTHGGVDFLGEEGDAVRAADGGTVTRVYEDPLMGHCVEITHRGGYITRYCSLASEGLVQAEDVVSRGQTIGTIGTSAVTECEEGPHLHFEIWRLRAAQDPMNFLNEGA